MNVPPKDVKHLTACPECGSELVRTDSKVGRVLVSVALTHPVLAPAGKRCNACGWQVS